MSFPLSLRIRMALQKWQRRRVQRKYGQLFADVANILFRRDPLGLNFEDNTDEYEPEVGTVLPRLSQCNSPLDVRRVLHQEFARWFAPDIAGPEERYEAAAVDVWEAWKRFRRQDA